LGVIRSGRSRRCLLEIAEKVGIDPIGEEKGDVCE
jgi:hypothetical protein